MRSVGVIAYPSALVMIAIVGIVTSTIAHALKKVKGYVGPKLKRAFAIATTCVLQVAGYEDIKEQLRQNSRGKSGYEPYAENGFRRAKLKYVPRKRRNRWTTAIINAVFAAVSYTHLTLPTKA